MNQITIKVQTIKAFNKIVETIHRENIWTNKQNFRLCIECNKGEYLRFFADAKKAYQYLSEYMTQDAIDSLIPEREKRGATGAIWKDWTTGNPLMYDAL